MGLHPPKHLVSYPKGQPFLRWAGSKKKLIRRLSAYFGGTYTRYVEPFAGSACLFFFLQPSKAILGDLNPELIATYRAVKNHLPDVMKELQTLRRSRKTYLALRAINPKTLNPAKRAARFIFLNRLSFNGIYRTNKTGHFNVPYGGDKTGEIPSLDLLASCAQSLENARLIEGDFEKVLCLTQPGDFVYMDPPYSVGSRRVFNEYNAVSFVKSDLIRLRTWMEALAARNVAFVVSYAASKEGRYLAEGFYTRIAEVRRNVAGFAANRRLSKEVIISNIKPLSL